MSLSSNASVMKELISTANIDMNELKPFHIFPIIASPCVMSVQPPCSLWRLWQPKQSTHQPTPATSSSPTDSQLRQFSPSRLISQSLNTMPMPMPKMPKNIRESCVYEPMEFPGQLLSLESMHTWDLGAWYVSMAQFAM